MKFIEWDPGMFSTGHKIIDKQHKELVKIVNDLYASFLDNQEDKLSVAFENSILRARDYVNYHFDTEEKIMKALNYPGMNDHINEHRQFQIAISELFVKLQNKDNLNIKFLTKKLLMFLKDWLLNHIVETDQRFVAECATILRQKVDK